MTLRHDPLPLAVVPADARAIDMAGVTVDQSGINGVYVTATLRSGTTVRIGTFRSPIAHGALHQLDPAVRASRPTPLLVRESSGLRRLARLRRHRTPASSVKPQPVDRSDWPRARAMLDGVAQQGWLVRQGDATHFIGASSNGEFLVEDLPDGMPLVFASRQPPLPSGR